MNDQHSAELGRCTGASDCPAPMHVHGCYADRDGTACNDPADHRAAENALPKFAVGQHVTKPKGYPFPGWVVAVFANLAGDLRLVVESEVAPGMLHIFAPSQVSLSPERLGS